ncbi:MULTISPECIES: hypothetical protein [unclassified Nocardia]|uniref:hypothetical protein n=1 Tax=unclassified Nocardia TaxID=2637762 RepID=UPI001CE49E98|nr:MULTISPECIES: hypothetical protein [unclassified Nocardia]
MRPPIQPGTSTVIDIGYLPASGGKPERWAARATFRDHDGTIRRLRAVRTDPDEAADAIEDQLDE